MGEGGGVDGKAVYVHLFSRKWKKVRILERSKANSINSSLDMPKNVVASRAKWSQSNNWSWSGAKTGAYGYIFGK